MVKYYNCEELKNSLLFIFYRKFFKRSNWLKFCIIFLKKLLNFLLKMNVERVM